MNGNRPGILQGIVHGMALLRHCSGHHTLSSRDQAQPEGHPELHAHL